MNEELTLTEIFHELGLKTPFERYLENGEFHGWGKSDSSYLDLKLGESKDHDGKIVIDFPSSIDE